MYRNLLVAFVLLIAGCTTRPIPNIENHPIPLSAQSLSLAQIEFEISDAATARGWIVDKKADGYLVAAHGSNKYEAVIDIKFTQTSYSITYGSSRSLRESDGNIHYRYVRWVNILDQDIKLKLNQAGRKASRPGA